MNETELLNHFIESNKVSKNLEINIKVWGQDSDHGKLYIKEKGIVDNRIEVLKEQLRDIPDKKYSVEAKSTIINQLHSYIQEISKAIDGLRLSRSQSTVIDNMLFGSIIGDVYNSIVENRIHIPKYLCYTYLEDDSVEINDLKNFLAAEIKNVQAIENPDYLKLLDYFEEFQNRLRDTFIS